MNLATVIVLIIVVLIVCGCIYSAYSRVTGKTSCCCGGGISCTRKKSKKPYNPMAELTVHIDGMHCKHCQSSVDSALNDIEGVYAKVNLKKGFAKISCTGQVSDQEIIDAVEAAGFKVTSIER